MFSVLGIGAVTLILPFLPIGSILDFTPLPVSILLALVGMAALYVTASEAAKKLFYRGRPASSSCQGQAGR